MIGRVRFHILEARNKTAGFRRQIAVRFAPPKKSLINNYTAKVIMSEINLITSQASKTLIEND